MDYRSSVETVDEVTRRFTVEIPAELVSREMSETLANVASKTTIKGFRPGKAPKHLVEKMHGDRVRWEVANKLISSSLSDLVRSHELETVGAPQVDVSEFKPGEELKFTANVFLVPRPQITGYDSFEVTATKREPTQADIDRVIDGMRESKATVRPHPFRTTAQAGDVAETSISVSVEGGEESPREPLSIELGAGKFPKALEDALVGMNVGDSKAVETEIDANHPNEELRGKRAVYNVTLSSLSEKVLPEVDDEFAKSLNINVQTVLELRLKVRERLEQELSRETKTEVQTEILNQLLQRNEFAVPQVLIDDEIRFLLVRAGILDPNKVNPQEISVERFREHFGEVAQRRVRTAIVVDRIAQQESISIEQEDVDKALQELADKHSVSLDEVRKFIMRENQLDGLRLEISRNKVLELLESRASVNYKEPNPAEDSSTESGQSAQVAE